MSPTDAPEPLVEAARDLLAIREALNQPTQAAQILGSWDRSKAAQIGWAYSAVAEAFELAADVQRDPDRYGLDDVVGDLAALMLRRVARDLEVETDQWYQA